MSSSTLSTPTIAPVPTAEAIAAGVRHRSRPAMMWRAMRRDKAAVVSVGVLLFVTLVAVFAPWIAPYDPIQGNAALRLQGIGTPGHLLGLDGLPRRPKQIEIPVPQILRPSGMHLYLHWGSSKKADHLLLPDHRQLLPASQPLSCLVEANKPELQYPPRRCFMYPAVFLLS